MKRYTELEGSDIIQGGDEWKTCSNPDTWEPMPENLFGNNGWAIFTDCRRPVPFTGKVAFLVNYSPIIRVEVDTTGLTEEEIDQKISEEAKYKMWINYKEYLDNFHDNIDWENTKMDTECPAIKYPKGCEPENSYGESMDMGLTGFWMVVDKGQQSGTDIYSVNPKRFFIPKIERIDEPAGHDPLESDEVAWELAKLAGYDLDANGYICDFPHNRHV